MEISNLVVSHKKVSVDQIGKAWHGTCKDLIDKILSYPGIKECALLLTCNRVEVYVVGENTENVLRDFVKYMRVPERVIEIHTNDKCLEHLLRVASGLESMIVGEDQILGQVKYYYNLSKKLGGIKEILDVIFLKAIQVGKKVRRLTKINKGCVSIGSAAVALVERHLGTLQGKNILIIGAGEMGSLIAHALAHKNCNLYITNRTYSKAEELARKINGAIPVKFDEMEKYIFMSDIVFSATSSKDYIITKDTIENIMRFRDKELILVDLAVPRDIEDSVKNITGVKLFTIDSLREISEENLQKRLKEAKKAEELVKKELENLKEKLKDLKAEKAISLMYNLAERIKEDEITELYNKLHAKYGIGEDVKPILRDFLNSFVKKFLREPTVRLRLAARNGNSEVIKAVEYLFGEEHGVSEIKNEKTENRQTEAAVQRN